MLCRRRALNTGAPNAALWMAHDAACSATAVPNRLLLREHSFIYSRPRYLTSQPLAFSAANALISYSARAPFTSLTSKTCRAMLRVAPTTGEPSVRRTSLVIPSRIPTKYLSGLRSITSGMGAQESKMVPPAQASPCVVGSRAKRAPRKRPDIKRWRRYGAIALFVDDGLHPSPQWNTYSSVRYPRRLMERHRYPLRRKTLVRFRRQYATALRLCHRNTQASLNDSSKEYGLQSHFAKKGHFDSRHEVRLNRKGSPKLAQSCNGKAGSARYVTVCEGGSIERFGFLGKPTQFFHTSPRLEAPHSISSFSESSLSKQTTSESNGVNDSANSEGTQQTSDYSNSPTSSDQGRNQPNDDKANEQSSPSSDRDMKETSDSDQFSDSDQENGSENESDPESDMEEAEEHTPLSYQIPSELLDEALQAPPKTRASYWSQKLYRGPHGELLSVHYCRTLEVAERVAKYFLDEKAVGFDIEWRPWAFPNSIKENVSLIQLACEDRIALFHIALFPGKTPEQLVPPTLKTIMESPNIYKVGVAVKGDCSRLEKHLDIHSRGVFELSRLHNLVEHYATAPSKVNHRLISLATQVQHHLLLPLYKGEPLLDSPRPHPDLPIDEAPLNDQHKGSVRESDWSQKLDMDQIQYAADDAYAGFRLFDILESKRKMLKPAPPQPRLCDFDPPTEPRNRSTKPKSKLAKKEKTGADKTVTEALGAAEVEEGEDESQEYETAPEEFEDEEEDEDSESESEASEAKGEDPDADYVPQNLRRRAIDQGSEGSAQSLRVSTRRVGRIDLSGHTSKNLKYPALPAISVDGNSTDPDSDAFEPLPEFRPRPTNDTPKAIELDTASLEMNTRAEHDEYADPELEEALLGMEIDTQSGKVEDIEVTEAPNEALGSTEANYNDAMDLDAGNVSTTEESKERNGKLKDAEASSSARLEVSTPPPLTFKPLVPETIAYSPEFERANSWVESYKQSTIPSASAVPSMPSSIRATGPHLRAYHLWHHQHIPLEAIGAHLRDPPLAQSTVSNYILQAVNLEKLEYRDEDLRNVMRAMPAGVQNTRWRWLSQKLGIAQ